jgi:hypothetical protein
LQFQLGKRGRPVRVRPEFQIVDDDTIIGSTHWLAEDGTRAERYQVLTIRGDKIVDIQGCTSRREAERFARRTRAT